MLNLTIYHNIVLRNSKCPSNEFHNKIMLFNCFIYIDNIVSPEYFMLSEVIFESMISTFFFFSLRLMDWQYHSWMTFFMEWGKSCLFFSVNFLRWLCISISVHHNYFIQLLPLYTDSNIIVFSWNIGVISLRKLITTLRQYFNQLIMTKCTVIYSPSQWYFWWR